MLKNIYIYIISLFIIVYFYIISMKIFEKEFIQKDIFITNVYDISSGDGYSPYVDFYYYLDSVKIYSRYNILNYDIKVNTILNGYFNTNTKEIVIANNDFVAILKLTFRKILENNNLVVLFVILLIINQSFKKK